MTNHQKAITPLTIEGIRAWAWVGNAWSDGEAFNSIHRFVSDESHSVEERAEALWIMGREGMGLDPEQNEEHLPPAEVLRIYHETCS